MFLILMENVNWSAIKGNTTSAPYLNNVLLPQSSYCEQYFTPPGLPGSLSNYLWLEAGTNFGVTDSSEPAAHVFTSTNHLITQLRSAAISWKAYFENISGTNCPTSNSGLYAAFHNPFVYFADIISNASYCVSHVRAFSKLHADLTSQSVARYNFIVPNLCNDMHNSSGCATSDRLRNGDNWVAAEIPRLLASAAYSKNGAIFITWDEGVSPMLAGPIGMILLSPLAKGGGYAGTNRYTHASMLRTAQEIFGVRPFLGDAARAQSLDDLFQPTIYLAGPALHSDGGFQFTFGANPGKTNFILASSHLANWSPISTNIASTNTVTFRDSAAPDFNRRIYRVRQLP